MLTLPALSLISVCGLGAGKWTSIASSKFISFSFAIAFVGLVYPMLIRMIRRQDDSTVEKSQICKSLVIFVGINHLCAVSCSKETSLINRSFVRFF